MVEEIKYALGGLFFTWDDEKAAANWRKHKVRDFLLILSMLVGIASGFAAVLMKNMIHYTYSFFTEKLQVDAESIWFFILPFFGILLTWIFTH